AVTQEKPATCHSTTVIQPIPGTRCIIGGKFGFRNFVPITFPVGHPLISEEDAALVASLLRTEILQKRMETLQPRIRFGTAEASDQHPFPFLGSEKPCGIYRMIIPYRLPAQQEPISMACLPWVTEVTL